MTLNPELSRVTPMSVEPGDPGNKARLELLYEVGKKVGSASRLERLLEQVVTMTQRTLKAAASSVLLVSNKEHH